MKYGSWYVVEVSHFEGNPNHRAICQCIDNKNDVVEFFSYEDKLRKSVNILNHFKVIKEIKEMK